MTTARPDDFADVWSSDRAAQNTAYKAAMAATETPVGWAYSVWAEVVANLGHRDNHNRAIAAQLLANLARSDPEQRILADIDALVVVTRDERFVTARHALQSMWKIGLAGDAQRARLLQAMERRFMDAAADKNTTLIRFDIVEGLRRLYDATAADDVRVLALDLIGREEDQKYRKKYAATWR